MCFSTKGATFLFAEGDIILIYDIQKARIIKRLSAGLLDIILLAVLATGGMWFISWVSGYSNYLNSGSVAMEAYLTEFADFIEDTETGQLKEGAYDSFTDEQEARFQELRTQYLKSYQMVRALQVVIVSIGILFSVLILEFVIPLCLKNGQTVGKKAFNIGVVHINSVRINPLALFIRTLLGKFAIEIMVPAILLILFFWGSLGSLGIIAFALIVLLIIGVFFFTKNKTPIHDILAKTVVVDLGTQMIFESEEDLIAYKKSLAAADAEEIQAYDKDAIPGTGENAPYRIDSFTTKSNDEQSPAEDKKEE